MSRASRRSEERSGRKAPRDDAPAGPKTPPGSDPLNGRRVVLCVTGGIAAYKSAYLTRALVKAGPVVQVSVLMS